MNTVIILAIKDLRLLSRNRAAMFWIIVFPVVLALLFGATFGGGAQRGQHLLPIAVIDEADTAQSHALIQRLEETGVVSILRGSIEECREKVLKGKLDAYLVINRVDPTVTRFSTSRPPYQLQLGIDPAKKTELGVMRGVLTDVMLPRAETQSDLGLQVIEVVSEGDVAQSAYEIFFPSSILWGILACVQHFVISIATERTHGTFLRLRVSPLSWWQILGGKGLACFLACAVVSVFLLLFGHFLFGVRLHNPWRLTLGVVCVSLCFVGLTMFLATLARTVEGVSGIAWGVLLPMAMIGGGMIPLIAMPGWMATLSDLSPVKWGIQALEGAIWRGFTWQEMLLPCGILLAWGVLGFVLGVRRLSWGHSLA